MMMDQIRTQFNGSDDTQGRACSEASSRHRKSQRLAAAAHVDRGKSDRSEAAAAAIALFIDLELALARAQLFRAAPVQRLGLVFDRAVFGVGGFGKAVGLSLLAGEGR